MRQLTYARPGKVAWRDAPDATVGHATDAIVRPLAVARCDLVIVPFPSARLLSLTQKPAPNSE